MRYLHRHNGMAVYIFLLIYLEKIIGCSMKNFRKIKINRNFNHLDKLIVALIYLFTNV